MITSSSPFLCELLSGLHSSDRSSAALFLQYRLWERHDIASRAFASGLRHDRSHAGTTKRKTPEVEVTSEISIWQAPPAPPRVVSDIVSDASTPQMSCDEPPPCEPFAPIAATAGATASEPVGDSYRGLTCPWRLLGVLWFRAIDEGEWGPRRVIRAQALPRVNASSGIQPSHAADLTGLGVGASRYEFWIDAELGIIVSAYAYFDDQAFHIVRLCSVEIDSETP